MRRKAYSGKSTKIVKTSITLPEVLVRFAEAQMADEGHSTLSAYLVYLLHRAKEREEERQLALGKSSKSVSSARHGESAGEHGPARKSRAA